MTNQPRREGGRFGLGLAPGGLRLVQELINTALAERDGVPRDDLLAEPATARAWLDGALDGWSAATGNPAPAIELDRSDLAALRDHRELLRATLRAGSGGAGADRAASGAARETSQGGAGADRAASGAVVGASREVAAKVLLTVAADGGVRYEPMESGWRAVRALTSAEALLAQAAGTWGRLKTCAYPPCGACFYDSSPNRTRVWHDTKMCGNISNLRASRSRRRAG